MEALRAKSASRTRKSTRHHAKWINDQLVCSCRSRTFTIFREKVARKVHTRNARRRRRVAVCENNTNQQLVFLQTDGNNTNPLGRRKSRGGLGVYSGL